MVSGNLPSQLEILSSGQTYCQTHVQGANSIQYQIDVDKCLCGAVCTSEFSNLQLCEISEFVANPWTYAAQHKTSSGQKSRYIAIRISTFHTGTCNCDLSVQSATNPDILQHTLTKVMCPCSTQ